MGNTRISLYEAKRALSRVYDGSPQEWSQPPGVAESGAGARLLSWAQVKDRVGLSRSTVWRLIQERSFPPSVRISKGRVAWVAADIEAWMAARIRAAKGR